MDIFDTIDDFGIEEDYQFLNYINPPERKIRVLRKRVDHFITWDDKEFWRRFRLKKDTVAYLLLLIEYKIKHKTLRNHYVPPMHQLLLTLRFYATGSFYITIGDFGGLHNSTICKIIKRVTEAIASMRKKFVRLPGTREEILSIQEKFVRLPGTREEILSIQEKFVRLPGTREEILSIQEKFVRLPGTREEILSIQEKFVRLPGTREEILSIQEKFVRLPGTREEILSIQEKFVRLPGTREEILSIQEKFYNIARFPRVIAALDGTHIKIISPGGDTAENFRNRKGFFSLNVQAMCTSDLQFLDIVTRWPGSTHDSMIFSNSSAKYYCDTGAFGNGIILGDSGYFLTDYLLTPLSNPCTQVEQLYNESHIRTRNVIERCFGVWKRRFPVLSIGLRCKIPLAQDIIVATAILHNLACSRKEGEPPIDSEVPIPPQPVFPVVPVDGNTETTRPISTRDNVLEYFKSLLF